MMRGRIIVKVGRGAMYVNLKVENPNFDICTVENLLGEIVTVRPGPISRLRNKE
jgi:hypothetical protein